MTRPTTPFIVAGAGAAALLIWVLFWGWPWYASRQPAAVDPASAAAAADGRRINATLFYIGPDAQSLVAVTRDVPYGATAAGQARHILDAQLQPAPGSHYNAIPEGTRLLGVFVSDTGEAFVDLSPEVSANHSGGSLSELFTVYTIVNAITVSLPSVRAVQILIDGREVETLAGHVDLRHPLPANTTWVTTQ